MVIGELLGKIKEAEAEAARLVTDARNKATVLEEAAAVAVQRIQDDAMETIAKKTRVPANRPVAPKPAPEIKVEVDKKSLDAAAAFIVAEFFKRYT